MVTPTSCYARPRLQLVAVPAAGPDGSNIDGRAQRRQQRGGRDDNRASAPRACRTIFGTGQPNESMTAPASTSSIAGTSHGCRGHRDDALGGSRSISSSVRALLRLHRAPGVSLVGHEAGAALDRDQPEGEVRVRRHRREARGAGSEEGTQVGSVHA
jgi:hypothetical protein